MNLDYRMFSNICTILGTLCIVIFSSLLLAWSPLGEISIYWKDFGGCLMAWSAILFVLYFILRRKSVGPYFLYTAIVVLLAGLSMFFLMPRQATPELACSYAAPYAFRSLCSTSSL